MCCLQGCQTERTLHKKDDDDDDADDDDADDDDDDDDESVMAKIEYEHCERVTASFSSSR